MQSEQTAWRERIAALKNLPKVLRLVWRSAPGVVAGDIFLRVLAALTPLGILAVSKRIVDIVVTTTRTPGAHPPPEIWFYLAMEFALAASALVLGRAIDYCDT